MSRDAAGAPPPARFKANFAWYAVALIAILAAGAAVLAGWLPGPVIPVVIFAAVFWLLSFFMALAATIRDRMRRS